MRNILLAGLMSGYMTGCYLLRTRPVPHSTPSPGRQTASVNPFTHSPSKVETRPRSPHHLTSAGSGLQGLIQPWIACRV